MAIIDKLPGPLKKVPPIGWVLIAAVILAVLYLKGKGGSTTAAGSGLPTSAGGAAGLPAGAVTTSGTPIGAAPSVNAATQLPGTGSRALPGTGHYDTSAASQQLGVSPDALRALMQQQQTALYKFVNGAVAAINSASPIAPTTPTTTLPISSGPVAISTGATTADLNVGRVAQLMLARLTKLSSPAVGPMGHLPAMSAPITKKTGPGVKPTALTTFTPQKTYAA